MGAFGCCYEVRFTTLLSKSPDNDCCSQWIARGIPSFYLRSICTMNPGWNLCRNRKFMYIRVCQYFTQVILTSEHSGGAKIRCIPFSLVLKNSMQGLCEVIGVWDERKWPARFDCSYYSFSNWIKSIFCNFSLQHHL